MQDAQPEKVPVFDRATFEKAGRVLVKKGHANNAIVWRVRIKDADWVVKDFSQRAWLVRWTFGRFFIGHETRILRRLAGMDGVPQRVFRIDRDALAMLFFEGCDLPEAPPEKLTTETLQRLEALVLRLHARGIVHLDLRNTRNMMLGKDGQPFLLDFQSALLTAWLPSPLRRFLQRIDLSGVWKLWLRKHPETLGGQRESVLLWQLRTRSLWPFRGYRPLFYRRKLHPDEVALLEKYATQKWAARILQTAPRREMKGLS